MYDKYFRFPSQTFTFAKAIQNVVLNVQQSFMHEYFVAFPVRQEDANKAIVLQKIFFFHDIFQFLEIKLEHVTLYRVKIWSRFKFWNQFKIYKRLQKTTTTIFF